MKHDPYKVNILILAGILALSVITSIQMRDIQKSIMISGLAAEQQGSADVVPVEFYVMSQCPYGIQVENAVGPVLERLRDNVQFRIDYIAEGAAGTFRSLHGQKEVEGDKIQLCVQKKYPQEFMDFVECQNRNPQDLAATVDACSRETGISSTAVQECWKGEEGNMLLEESIKNARQAGATGSPTIFINNKAYRGERSSQAFLSAICDELAHKPGSCKGAIESKPAAVQGGCG